MSRAFGRDTKRVGFRASRSFCVSQGKTVLACTHRRLARARSRGRSLLAALGECRPDGRQLLAQFLDLTPVGSDHSNLLGFNLIRRYKFGLISAKLNWLTLFCFISSSVICFFLSSFYCTSLSILPYNSFWLASCFLSRSDRLYLIYSTVS